MHYVFKGCDTTARCEAEKDSVAPSCKRDWYDDWECHECCNGDLCNYYVTLAASTLQKSVLLTVSTVICAWFLKIR